MTDAGRLVSRFGVILGTTLIVIGVGAYVITEFESATALIPAIFGLLIAALGEVGRRTAREQVSVYGIGLLALLGVAGSAQGLPELFALLAGENIDSVVASVAQSATVVIGLILLGAVGKYVLQAR